MNNADPSGKDILACIILAAGSSRRFGAANKLLADMDGKPMVAHATEAAGAAALGPVIVVTGCDEDQIRAALAHLDVKFVHNPAFADGMAASLSAGIVAASAAGAAGAFVILGDMPWLEVETLSALADAFRETQGSQICVPVAQGRRGNPVLFPADLFGEIEALKGDRGAKSLLDTHAARVTEIPLQTVSVLEDIDVADQVPGPGRKR